MGNVSHYSKSFRKKNIGNRCFSSDTVLFSSHHTSSHTAGFCIFEQMKAICVDLCLQPIREQMLPSCAFRNAVDVRMFQEPTPKDKKNNIFIFESQISKYMHFVEVLNSEE